jgi:tetratricopeptide repeat family protein
MDKYSVLKKIDKYLEEKDYIKARKLIRNDLKRYGTKEEYYMYLGYASTDAEERLKNYQKAIDENPKNLDATINIANAYDEIKNHDKAIEFYNKAIEMDKTCALAFNNRGYSYFNKQEYEKALLDYDKALLLNPKLEIAQDNRTKLLEIIAEKEEFKELVKNSEANQKNYHYYFNLGMAEARLGEYDKALDAYNKSIELKPDFAPCYLFRGILEHGKGNLDKANEDYSKAIEIDENLIDAYFNKAQIVFSKENPETNELKSALKYLEKAVELDPKFIDALYSIAVIQKKLEEYHEAIKTLDKILEIAPDSVNSRALKKLIIKKYLN